MDVSLLQRMPLFAGLPKDEIYKLTHNLYPTEYPANTVVFREGDSGNCFSIILKGRVEIVKALGTSEERVLSVLKPGDYLGEMSLLYQDKQRSASVRTLTPARLLNMAPDDFEMMLARQPLMTIQILREMGVRLRNSENATIRDLQEKNDQLVKAYKELQAAQAQLIEKEKLEYELQMAHNIQESILPKAMPDLPGWQVGACWKPARAVSGDFYDFIPFPDGKMGIVIGDVTGKGMPAALVMATTRSVVRATAKQFVQPSEVLYQANDLLCPDMPANMFVTCLYALLDPLDGKLIFANAGHTLPYQRTSQGVIELRATGMPLGLLPDMSYELKEAHLEEGDCALFYSDGITEAHNPQNEMFDTGRLRENLNVRDSNGGVIETLLNKLADFTGPTWEQEDDVTLVVLERSN